jgi:hypothetical protein
VSLRPLVNSPGLNNAPLISFTLVKFLSLAFNEGKVSDRNYLSFSTKDFNVTFSLCLVTGIGFIICCILLFL